MSAGTPSRHRVRHHVTARTPWRSVLSVVSALALALALALPVLAHAELETSDPAADSTVEGPVTTVTLTFSEGLVAAKSSFRILGADGEAGTGTAAADGATEMSADGLALGAGAYTVEWTSAAEDGDIERGTFTFTVTAPVATPSPTPSPTQAVASTAPATAIPVATAPATVAPSPSADTGTVSAAGGDVILPITVALVLLGIVAFFLLRRNRAA
jgi:copper transport protein